MGRNTRGIRQARMKVQLGIAAAALVGGGAIGAVAVAASTSSAPATAQSAAYGWNVRNPSHQQVALTSAVSSWKKAQQKQHTSLANALARLAGTQNFATVRVRGTTLAAQLGVELTATNHFLVVQSADGTVNVWVLSGATRFRNVTGSTTGVAVRKGAKALAKGDTIFVEGVEQHGDLAAALVLFSTKTTITPTPTPTATKPTTTVSPTSPTPTGTGTTMAPTTPAPTTTAPTTAAPTTTAPTKPAPTTTAPTSSAPPTFGGVGS